MALSDSDLIIRAQNGDAMAFEELVYRYDKNVLSIALKYTNNEDEAKDIYQDVFIRVFKGLKNFQFKSEFSTWIYRITTNVCLTFKTNSKKHSFVPIENDKDDDEDNFESVILSTGEEESNPDNIAAYGQLENHLNELLEQLPPKQKLCFVLKHYEGYKIREIAKLLECQDGTVKKYLFEATHKLRSKLVQYTWG